MPVLKPRPMKSILCGSTLAIILAASASSRCLAQTKQPPTSAVKSNVIPKDLFRQMAVAYKKLHSYSVTMRGTIHPEDAEHKSENHKFDRQITDEIAIRYPDHARISRTDWRSIKQATDDGIDLFLTSSDDKLHYLKNPCLPGIDGVERTLMMTGATDSASMLAGRNMLDLPRLHNLKSLVFSAPHRIGEVDVYVIKGAFAGAVGTTTFTAEIGKADHLLYRWTEKMKMTSTGSMIMIADYSDMKVDPDLPDSVFTFTPPTGAKRAGVPSLGYYDADLAAGGLPAKLDAIDTQNKPISLAQYKGNVVLLDYWATWCAPCMQEVPGLVATYQKYHSYGFEIVGISLDSAEKRKTLSAFTKKHGMSWRQICDAKTFDSPLIKAYKVTGIPFTLLIGRDGKIATVGLNGAALETAVTAALMKK